MIRKLHIIMRMGSKRQSTILLIFRAQQQVPERKNSDAAMLAEAPINKAGKTAFFVG